RYYDAGDREPAAALAPLVAPALDGDAPEARDFTDYPTPAAAGTVEVWLAGAPDAGAPRTGSRTAARSAPATPLRGTPATAAPAPYQIPGVIAPAPTRAEQVERILLERLRQGG
ncbi:MAG TPA: hypothetical protein PK452_17390, partial [Amaricoccus sp.]|nr:hypothetical protein [Amaricoccus sp.]